MDAFGEHPTQVNLPGKLYEDKKLGESECEAKSLGELSVGRYDGVPCSDVVALGPRVPRSTTCAPNGEWVNSS